MTPLLNRLLLALCIVLPGLALAEARANASQDPLELVRDTADEVLKKVVAEKQTLKQHPGRIYDLVEKGVVPHFDFERMSRLAVGRYWRRATPEQKKAFAEAFKQLLVRTYATALLEYSNQPIRYMPPRPSSRPDEAMVSTRVDNGGPLVPINYRLHFENGEWKVYDVIVDGVSLVSNYRSSFSSQIRRYGMDGLISRLQKHNQKQSG